MAPESGFVWDEAKRIANVSRHGIDFPVITRFDWESALIWQDVRREYGEPRFIAIGRIGVRLHVAVYTPRENQVRIISLRKANQKESKRYEKT